MRYLVVLAIFSLEISCESKKTPPPQYEPYYYSWDYKANVTIEGDTIPKFIEALKTFNGSKYFFVISFESASKNLAYNIGLYMKVTPPISGEYTLHNLYVNSDSYASYSELCCYSGADQFNWIYFINEDDSLTNKLTIYTDSISHELSGKFYFTMTRSSSPYDTISVGCDTFYCKYSER